MKSERRGIVIAIGVLLLSAALGGIYGPNVRATTASADDYQGAVRDFTRVLDVVQNNYADQVDVDKAVYQGAIPGMLRMLDPHSSFFDAKQFSLLREDQRGKYYGVGMIVGPRENHTVVLAPYAAATAYNAGIRPGDVIVKVDDKSTEQLSTTEVADLLKGPKGRRARVWRQHDGMIFPRSYDHSDAVVFPALVFAEERKLFGVKKAGVRIEHPEHARNCSLVDGLVHVHLVGVVVLDHVQNAGEVAHCALIVVRRSRGSPHIGPVNAPQCSG